MHPLVTPKRGCTYAPLAKHSRMTMWQNRTDVSTNEVTQLYFEEFSLPTIDMNLTCHSPAVGQGKISWLTNCLAQEKCLAPIVRFAGFAIGHHFFCHFCYIIYIHANPPRPTFCVADLILASQLFNIFNIWYFYITFRICSNMIRGIDGLKLSYLFLQ